MEGILRVASNISTPLALGGLCAAILFLILRQMIAANLFPVLEQAFGGHLLRLIVNRLFILALVAMILGFIAYILVVLVPAKPVGQGISLTLPPKAKLSDTIKFLAQLENYTADITSSCDGKNMDVEIEGGPVMAKSTVELIELLRLRVIPPAPRPQYKVVRQQEKGTYEIICQ